MKPPCHHCGHAEHHHVPHDAVLPASWPKNRSVRVCLYEPNMDCGCPGYEAEPGHVAVDPAVPGRATYHRIAAEVADLVGKKQAAYGDSFGKSGAVMRILYPGGIRPDQMDDALVVVRILDKLFRIATDRDALGEDPWLDVNGYSLLAASRTRRKGDPK